MEQAPTIYCIFEKADDKHYTTNALLKQDILSYYFRVIKKEKEYSFRFWDLGMWLLTKNLEFSNYYKGSHLKHRDRFDNRKTRMLSALNDLIGLRLIRGAGTAKAKKVDIDVQIYEYTKGGQLLALLIKGLDPKQRQSANSEIYDLAVNAYGANEDSSSITISRFLRKCKDRGLFNKLVDYVYYLVHLDLKFKTSYDLFQYIFNSDFRGSDVQRELVALWFETVQELEPEIRKLMVYGFKRNVENRFENKQESLSREYEQFRFELRGDHEKIALEGYCLNCKRKGNLGIHYSQYLKIINNNVIRAQCSHCGLKESVTILCN
jgi:hypothetical protein